MRRELESFSSSLPFFVMYQFFIHSEFPDLLIVLSKNANDENIHIYDYLSDFYFKNLKKTTIFEICHVKGLYLWVDCHCGPRK